MALLKKIKFGNVSTPIAKTVVTAASESVLTVGAPSGKTNGIDEDADYGYEIDLTLSNDGTLTKDNGALKVGTVPAAQVSVAAGGHVADSEDGKIFTGDDVEEVLTELNTKIENVDGAAKSYTIVDDTANVQDLPANVLKRYRLQQTVGSTDTLVGAAIDIPKDSSLKEVYLGASTDTIDATTGVITKNTVTDPQSMNFAYQLADGTYSLVKIDVSKFLTESEFGDGLEVTNGVVSAKLGNGIEFGSEATGNKSLNVKIDSSSETDSASSPAAFLSVGANGVKISGIKDEIDRKIAALDYSDTAVAGQYVSEVDEAEGVISVTRADVAAAPLNGYTKGSTEGALAATDTINEAFSKLENTIENNEQTTAAALNSLNDDLTAEVTRAQTAEAAIDTAVGLTKASGSETRSITATTNYGTGSTTVMGNMQALDTQVKANAVAISTLQTTVGGISYELNGTELILHGIPAYVAPQS